jgi:hypothetical protein
VGSPESTAEDEIEGRPYTSLQFLTLILVASRLILALQYLETLWHVRDFKKTRLLILLMISQTAQKIFEAALLVPKSQQTTNNIINALPAVINFGTSHVMNGTTNATAGHKALRIVYEAAITAAYQISGFEPSDLEELTSLYDTTPLLDVVYNAVTDKVYTIALITSLPIGISLSPLVSQCCS